jgi:O-antigen/teichoic acid export membrane protein
VGFQLVVANQLGADRYGLVALALASAALLSPLADGGFPNLALRLVSEDPHDPARVARIWKLKLLALPLFLLPLLLWCAKIGIGGGDWRVLLWAGAFYGFQAASDLLRQVLRARHQIRGEIAARLAYPAGNLLAVAVAWRFHPGPAGALCALAFGPASLTASYFLVAKPSRPRVDASEVFALARSAYPALAQSVGYLILVGLATRVEAFVLERCAGRAEVGRYFAALNLVMAGSFFAQGLSSYLYPRLHRQASHRGRALARAAGIQGALGLSLWAGAALVGPIVFHLVYRTRSFEGIDALLPGLGLVLCLSCLDWLWLSVLVGADKIWIAALNLVPVLAAKLLLAPLLIPSMGARGMVLASVVGQAGTCLLGAWAAARAYLAEPVP